MRALIAQQLPIGGIPKNCEGNFSRGQEEGRRAVTRSMLPRQICHYDRPSMGRRVSATWRPGLGYLFRSGRIDKYFLGTDALT